MLLFFIPFQAKNVPILFLKFLNPILHGGGGGWIPPLLTLVLNHVSGIQAIVLMLGDFS